MAPAVVVTFGDGSAKFQAMTLYTSIRAPRSEY